MKPEWRTLLNPIVGAVTAERARAGLTTIKPRIQEEGHREPCPARQWDLYSRTVRQAEGRTDGPCDDVPQPHRSTGRLPEPAAAHSHPHLAAVAAVRLLQPLQLPGGGPDPNQPARRLPAPQRSPAQQHVTSGLGIQDGLGDTGAARLHGGQEDMLAPKLRQ